MYPIYLKLENQRCLVVGGGSVAERKTMSLIESGAKVTLISPDITVKLADIVEQNIIKYHKRPFKNGDTNGFFLIIASTNSAEVNSAVYKEAANSQILINSVDDPKNCNFYVPAQVKKGDLQIAISTSGKLPLLSGRLRAFFDELIPSSIGEEINTLHQLRKEIIKDFGDDEDLRRSKIKALLDPKIEQLLKKEGLK